MFVKAAPHDDYHNYYWTDGHDLHDMLCSCSTWNAEIFLIYTLFGAILTLQDYISCLSNHLSLSLFSLSSYFCNAWEQVFCSWWTYVTINRQLLESPSKPLFHILYSGLCSCTLSDSVAVIIKRVSWHKTKQQDTTRHNNNNDCCVWILTVINWWSFISRWLTLINHKTHLLKWFTYVQLILAPDSDPTLC